MVYSNQKVFLPFMNLPSINAPFSHGKLLASFHCCPSDLIQVASLRLQPLPGDCKLSGSNEMLHGLAQKSEASSSEKLINNIHFSFFNPIPERAEFNGFDSLTQKNCTVNGFPAPWTLTGASSIRYK